MPHRESFLNPSSFSRIIVLLLTISLLVFGPSARGQQASSELLSNVDPGWLDSYRDSANHQFDLIVAAYSLDDKHQAALRQELDIRLMQQKIFEDKELAEWTALIEKMSAAGDVEDSPESKAVMEKMNFIGKNMPLADDNVANWMDQQMGPAANEGRMRWEELRQHGASSRDVGDDDLAAKSAIKSDFGHARAAADPTVLPGTEQPLPGDPKGARVGPEAEKYQKSASKVAPNAPPAMDEERVAAKAPDRRLEPWMQEPPSLNATAVPDGAMPEPVEAFPAQVRRPPSVGPSMPPPAPGAAAQPAMPPAVLPAAPPLDDWDKYVLSLAQKYKFSEAQMTNAQSILRDLKRRANQYRLSRADDYARGQLMTNAKAREDQLKSLNRTLDALFDELKQRLEALPTVEQKLKAGSTPQPAAPVKGGRK